MKRREFIIGGTSIILCTDIIAQGKNLSITANVDPKFMPVLYEFEKNFVDRGETNASCCIYYKGRKVVDIWGRVENEPELIITFSVSKGMSAACLAMAHSRGLFTLDEKVSKYWPEFTGNGKENIMVRELLNHGAGLIQINGVLYPRHLENLDVMARILAKQIPQWEPGKTHGYHTLSLGWFESELLRRVDPQKRSIGKFFQEEIATPLGIEYYIGLPDRIKSSRVCKIRGFERSEVLANLDKLPRIMVVEAVLPWSPINKSISCLKIDTPQKLNERNYQRVEIPSANGIGTARAVAKVYCCLAEKKIISQQTLEEITGPCRERDDQVLRLKTAYSFGFSRPSTDFNFGSDSKCFGCQGLGGSFGMADPTKEVGYAYITNELRVGIFNDERELSVRRKFYDLI